jgi:uncharacterized lipoprotein NlpE involved in copper resistance
MKSSTIINFQLNIIALLFLQIGLFAQNQPINSNYLIENGISPRVLDAAASLFMQDGRFAENVIVKVKNNEGEKSYDVDLIFDPMYNEGMDIRAVINTKNIEKKELKQLKKYLEKSHYFSRMSRKYLYDESTLKLINKTANNLELEYSYQTKDIDPYLNYIKKIKGNIYIKNGVLGRVVLTNTKPLKNHISKYTKEIKYVKLSNGGYVISNVTEKFTVEKKNSKTEIEIKKNTLKYTDKEGKELAWEGKNTSEQKDYSNAETVDVKLGGTLPFLGKAATKMGFKLPRPFGVAAFVYAHSQNMEFTGLQVGFDGGDKADLNSLFELENSKVTQSTYMPLFKADLWIFPFLNVMVIAGGGKNDLNGELVINEDKREFVNDLGNAFNNLPGWLIDWPDIPNVPRAMPIKTTITSEVYGGGLTLAGGIDNFNLSVNYQLMFTKIVEANTTNMVNVITPMIGYMAPFGVNFMLGGQGQFYNTKLSGFIQVEDSSGDMHTIDYNVDFEPIKWNAILGIYKNFAKHWEMSFQAGFGQRTSLTAILGYRF